MQIVIKSADVSNETRPPEVSLPWMKKLFEEFGRQYEREVEVGVKETPFMNIKTVSKPSAQIGFIKYVHCLTCLSGVGTRAVYLGSLKPCPHWRL